MRKPRTCKTNGVSSYQAYVERLQTGRGRPSTMKEARVMIFAATCLGSHRLEEDVGLPLACVGAAIDARSQVRGMSDARHGSLVPCGDERAFRAEAGWDRWEILHIGPDMVGDVQLGERTRVTGGAIETLIGGPICLAELRMALAGSLRHLRFHDVASRGEAVLARTSRGGSPFVPPRYTAAPVHGALGYHRVDDLYVFDPWRHLRTLAVTIEATLMELGDRCIPQG